MKHRSCFHNEFNIQVAVMVLRNLSYHFPTSLYDINDLITGIKQVADIIITRHKIDMQTTSCDVSVCPLEYNFQNINNITTDAEEQYTCETRKNISSNTLELNKSLQFIIESIIKENSALSDQQKEQLEDIQAQIMPVNLNDSFLSDVLLLSND